MSPPHAQQMRREYRFGVLTPWILSESPHKHGQNGGRPPCIDTGSRCGFPGLLRSTLRNSSRHRKSSTTDAWSSGNDDSIIRATRRRGSPTTPADCPGHRQRTGALCDRTERRARGGASSIDRVTALRIAEPARASTAEARLPDTILRTYSRLPYPLQCGADHRHDGETIGELGGPASRRVNMTPFDAMNR